MPCTPVALTYERLPSTLPSGNCLPTRRGRLTTAVQAAHIALRAFPHGARLRCGSVAGTLIPGSVRKYSVRGAACARRARPGPPARSARSKTGSSMKFVFHVQVAVSSWILTTQLAPRMRYESRHSQLAMCSSQPTGVCVRVIDRGRRRLSRAGSRQARGGRTVFPHSVHRRLHGPAVARDQVQSPPPPPPPRAGRTHMHEAAAVRHNMTSATSRQVGSRRATAHWDGQGAEGAA